MKPLKELSDAVKSPDFYLHAGAVLVGFKASDLINGALSGVQGIPDKLRPFVGPAVVVIASPFLGKKFGAYVLVGAGVNVLDSILGMLNFPQGQIRQG
jgi:hypothetical protein